MADLRGRAVDGGAEGSPISFVLNQALIQAGLKRSDVRYSNRLIAPPDWLAGLRNKAVDALPAVEPVATQIVDQGFGVALTSTQRVVPWFQESFFAASAHYLAGNRAAALGFLEAYLRAAKEIDAAGGKWTPEFLQTVSHWSQIPEDVVATVPGPVYYGQFGTINLQSLSRQEEYWLSIGQVKDKVDPALIVDFIAHCHGTRGYEHQIKFVSISKRWGLLCKEARKMPAVLSRSTA